MPNVSIFCVKVRGVSENDLMSHCRPNCLQLSKGALINEKALSAWRSELSIGVSNVSNKSHYFSYLLGAESQIFAMYKQEQICSLHLFSFLLNTYILCRNKKSKLKCEDRESRKRCFTCALYSGHNFFTIMIVLALKIKS